MSDDEEKKLTTIYAARLEVDDVHSAIAKKFSGTANVQGLPSFHTMLPDRQARREASTVLRARGFKVTSLLKGDML